MVHFDRIRLSAIGSHRAIFSPKTSADWGSLTVANQVFDCGRIKEMALLSPKEVHL